LCDASSLHFDIGGFKLFEEELTKKHLTAFDIADALFSTVTFFAEGAYLCFSTGSLKPLLINDIAAMELDEEYARIVTWWDLVKNGNLQRVAHTSDAEFDRRLEQLSTKLVNLSATLKGFDKKIVGDKLMKCLTMKNDYITLKISSGVRKAPFAIELFGESSQGKTTFGDQLIDALLTSASLPTSKDYRAALNPSDKFMSNWTSDKLVMIIDDIANMTANFVERAPTQAIIDVCNNQMYYAPKAELEAKGKCFVEPEIVLATTNKKNMDAGVYSNCPYSIQRRMQVVATVEAKREFQRIVDNRTCGIDPSKVRKFYTVDGVYTPPVVDDIWEISLELPEKPAKLTTIAEYAPVVHNGKEMTKVSSIEAIQYIIGLFTEHRLNQTAIIDSMQERTNVMHRCGIDGCHHIEGMCPDHPIETQFGLESALAISRLTTKVKS